jgi:hypothetical protein
MVLTQSNDSSIDYAKTETDEIIRPVVPPLISTPVIHHPVQPPKPITPTVVIVDPIVINQSPKERPRNDRIPSYDLRDPLHGHGNRGNDIRNSELAKRDGNNSGNRR